MLQGIAALMVGQLNSSSGTVAPTVGDFNANASTSTSVTNTLSGVPAGALLVVTSASANQSTDNDPNNAGVTSVPVLTWTPQIQSSASGSGGTKIWTATFTAGGSITTTCSWPGSGTFLSAVLYRIVGNEAVPSGASNSATAQTAPSVALTTTKSNSIILCVTSDFAAVDPSGHTYRRTVTETLLDDQSGGGIYVGYHYYDASISIITSYTEGLTVPSTQAAGTSILEIRGA